MVRGPVLRVVLITGLSRGCVSVLCELSRLFEGLRFKARTSKRWLGSPAVRKRTVCAVCSPRWHQPSARACALGEHHGARRGASFLTRAVSVASTSCHAQHGVANWRSWLAKRRCSINRLTLPSSGRLPACFARFQPPLMSNVSRHVTHRSCASAVSPWSSRAAHASFSYLGRGDQERAATSSLRCCSGSGFRCCQRCRLQLGASQGRAVVARGRLDPARTQSTQFLLGVPALWGSCLALVEWSTSAHLHGAGRRRRLGWIRARAARLAQGLSARRICSVRRVLALAKSARSCSRSVVGCWRVVVALGTAASHTAGGWGRAPGRWPGGARVQSHRSLSTEHQNDG